jgi:hypothetical protein
MMFTAKSTAAMSSYGNDANINCTPVTMLAENIVEVFNSQSADADVD